MMHGTLSCPKGCDCSGVCIVVVCQHLEGEKGLDAVATWKPAVKAQKV
jgi:hypothetical protein